MYPRTQLHRKAASRPVLGAICPQQQTTSFGPGMVPSSDHSAAAWAADPQPRQSGRPPCTSPVPTAQALAVLRGRLGLSRGAAHLFTWHRYRDFRERGQPSPQEKKGAGMESRGMGLRGPGSHSL